MRTARLANVDLRDGEYLIYALSRTQDGFWITTGWMTRLPGDAAPGDIGRAIRNAWSASELGIATPDPGDNPFRFALRAVGVDDFAAYSRGTKEVAVELDSTHEQRVTVTPNRRTGRGFVPMLDHEIEQPVTSDADLGHAVTQAFAVAR